MHIQFTMPFDVLFLLICVHIITYPVRPFIIWNLTYAMKQFIINLFDMLYPYAGVIDYSIIEQSLLSS